MTETVGFAWWRPGHGGSQQAFVGNYRGLKTAGYDVHAYERRGIGAMVEAADRFDWTFVPFVFDPEWIERLAEYTHVHLQIGGYGRDDFDAASATIDAADSVSVLDPQLAAPFGVPDAPWVPNPPNLGLFDATDSTEGYVLIPKHHEDGGLGPARDVVESNSGETFVVLGSSFEDPPDNVTIRPKVPWSWMPQVYADARAVLNPREREGLPNVAYEAFLTATPYVYHPPGGIGDTQEVKRPLLDRIGRACQTVIPDDHRTRDHVARTLGEATPEVGRAGREWAEAWDGWDWGAKMDAIATLVG